MEEKFTVWQDYNTEGWKPSHFFDNVDEAVKWALENNYGNKIRITKEVAWQAQENSEDV